MLQKGLWFDGRSAREWPVQIEIGAGQLILIDEHGTRHVVEVADLVRLNSAQASPRLGHRMTEGWRLILHEPLDPRIEELLPRRAGSLIAGPSRRKIGILASLAALVMVTSALVILAPEALAQRMPMSWERQLGALYEMPVSATRCENARVRSALDALMDRLDPDARSDGLTLELVSLDLVNAVALPGGRIVLFSGLVNEVQDPDALAGILAHEIAHVRRRHVAAAIVRELGVGAVVTIIGGGAITSNASSVLSLKFSRSAEAEADGDAIELLNKAGIDPRPTGRFFDRMYSHEGTFQIELLSSHPVSADRAKRFKQGFDPGRAYRPSLGSDDAEALLGC